VPVATERITEGVWPTRWRETETETDRERERDALIYPSIFPIRMLGYVSLRYTDSQLELREESG